ncbi:MAG: nucleotidyltransferase family protein [Ignavibacteria bacterium]|nr:nucleotidyltransferase family protein [Ignavibacteria bacterium]
MTEKRPEYRARNQTSFGDILDTLGIYFKGDNRIDKAWVFGSYARNQAKPSSDLDVLIEQPEGGVLTLFDLADIQFRLEQFLGLKVDLTTKRSINPDFLPQVISEMKLVYDATIPSC